jgi:hypothetical protein
MSTNITNNTNNATNMENIVPNDWLCPITMELMKDPCIGPDGYTYERTAIEQWLAHNTISPMTRQVMSNNNIIPNIALRHTIEDFLMEFIALINRINHHTIVQ